MMMSMAQSTPSRASDLVLDQGYVLPSGAILTYYKGTDIIDPYFPTKALLTANDSGMNINGLANGWINWLLARQEKDGLFSRFCRDDVAQDYHACLIADADDAMMAMWIELLYRMAPDSGMPERWKHSAQKAEKQLDALFDPARNIYHISKAMPVGLLMDNIEIYASLKRASEEAKRMGYFKEAQSFHSKAERVKGGIIFTFWDEKAKRFNVSTQARDKDEFYPDRVAQLIPMLHGFSEKETGSDELFYKHWMHENRDQWLALVGKEYPWGLVAIVATNRKDSETAEYWLNHAASQRNGGIWNVLDEAAFQSVAWRLQKNKDIRVASCQECPS